MTPAQTRNGTLKPATPPFSLVADDLAEVETVYTLTIQSFRSKFPTLLQQLGAYRGKRLRPALLLLIAQATGNIANAHHTLGAVVEMIHTATLVHDDVLDEASTRRHTATINAEFGNKVSILLGDMLFSSAFALCSSVDAQACTWIGEATNKVCAGELLQTMHAGNLHLNERTYLEIIAGKTGALTEVCARLGAHYAGASPEMVERLAGFGRDLGCAFQIADDVLDLVGVEEVAGKTLGTDLQQQKLTLPLIHLFEKSSVVEADRYRALLQNGEPLVEAMQRAGALTYAQHKAEDLIIRAKRILQLLPTSDARRALEQLADWSVRRRA